jgi:hypothetical protein
MGYYTIRLDQNTSNLSLGKVCSHKRLTVDMAASPDIFQRKMLELIESLEYVQAHLDDILCMSCAVLRTT